MQVIVDDRSGFCFGVKKTIALAEDFINRYETVYCLGDIVHNEQEVARLEKLGLKVIDRKTYFTLKNCKVLLRAHGEPPETYEYAEKNNIRIIEGTCPVVLRVQSRIREKFNELNGIGTIVIFGKPTHPEVIGLNGQIDNKAVIVQDTDDLDQVDLSVPIVLFAQTTMRKDKFQELKKELEKRLTNVKLLDTCDTICGQVSNRGPHLFKFSQTVDAVIFVGGKKSSNSKVLFHKCVDANPNTWFVSSPEDLDSIDLKYFDKVGICGATSTPHWLMTDIAEIIESRYNRNA